MYHPCDSSRLPPAAIKPSTAGTGGRHSGPSSSQFYPGGKKTNKTRHQSPSKKVTILRSLFYSELYTTTRTESTSICESVGFIKELGCINKHMIIWMNDNFPCIGTRLVHCPACPFKIRESGRVKIRMFPLTLNSLGGLFLCRIYIKLLSIK